ncbi:WPP domain-associated protein-like [Iris pallida]|uniref:WPP domain-associated protein-like n=1 Tax=Iris pallida TaxID=29817 RepID=A0AAX6E0W7_IRIPA|nr:WPP domain-associated protein-like [Iris pallida]
MAGDFSGLANGHLSAPSMEPVEFATVDTEVDGKVDISSAPVLSAHVLSCSSFKGSETVGNESALYEKFLLDDLDNYWDEINDRLTVSRMVSDSVIKGMVRAVVEESAEKITSKEEQIAILNEKLQLYDSKAATDIGFVELPLHQCYSRATGESENLDSLKLAVEQQLLLLKDDFRYVQVSSSHGRGNATEDVGLCSVLPEERTSEQSMRLDARVDSVREALAATFEEIKHMFSSLKASVFEQQLEFEFGREINSIIVQSHVRHLHSEFERKLYEERNLAHMLSTNWQEKVTELSNMREELDNISRSFLSSESSSLISQNSHESSEESNGAKRNDQFPRMVSGNVLFPYTTHVEENCTGSIKKCKDIAHPMLDFVDVSQIKHLNKDELVTYYTTEVLKMRRQHELALQEKTEELFCLKREFLKEKGSPFRRDKEIELLKKKIPEVIFKLDDILLEKHALPRVESSYDELCSLKDKINALLSENQHLQGLLTEKEEEVNCLSSQISDAANRISLQSSAETNFLTQINKLTGSLEDMKIEASIRSDFLTIIFKEVLGEYICNREDIEVEAKLVQEIYITAIRGIIGDVLSSGHSKSSLEALLSENQNLLSKEIEEKGKLKEALMSLSTLLKEKDNVASKTDSAFMQHKEQFDLVNKECTVLREQVSKQEMLISKINTDSNLLKRRLGESLQQNHQYEAEIHKLNEELVIASNAMKEAEKKCTVLREQVSKQEMLISNIRTDSNLLKRRLGESLQQNHQYEAEIHKLNEELVVASNALKEAEKQKTMLRGIIEDEEKKKSSSTKENMEAKQMHSIILSMKELSEEFIALENNLTKKIERFETRMKDVSREVSPLLQQTKQLLKKGQWYKQMLDIRYSNLQKAEAEVDLLGDEVDALLSLLGKIYIALDHYSPVLQLYPGVMEILNLVRRELEGGRTRAE